ncbi:hypothetical protein FA15DRAFT_666313 [Coprinopsis marcescibilis]|uniref:Peptidase M43 pregnancy-associated plasma-A domain-containing protein n=1 Tax=Coprinopsis marcescibilis TaxID=230819 RepID=A0A5C3L404_COPMA|nr:hypothetical protein FA15DRAFT_666313 [Coprinopsis marcescibilis]
MRPNNLFALVALGLGQSVLASPGFHFRPSNTQATLSASAQPSSEIRPHDKVNTTNETAVSEATNSICGTESSIEEAAAQEQRFNAELIPYATLNRTLSFTIWFHVIAANETVEGGWLPSLAVRELAEKLNDDFSLTGVEFHLAGIRRVINREWFDSVTVRTEHGRLLDDKMKRALRRGGRNTLNVYTVGLPDGLAGYANFPWSYHKQGDQGDDAVRDGVVMRWDSNAAKSGNDIGSVQMWDALSHQVGHWVGLYHTFQGTGCAGDSDFVDDTPMQAAPSISTSNAGCNFRDTCGGKDELSSTRTNFMDYSSNDCEAEFTPGQIRRMQDILTTYRMNIQ